MHPKTKLLNLVIMVRAVSFLKQVVAWNNEANLLVFGRGIAVVIAAPTYSLGPRQSRNS